MARMLWRCLPFGLMLALLVTTRANADSGFPDLDEPYHPSPVEEKAPRVPAPEQEEAGYRDHPLHLELIVGADTRVGELGGSLEYAFGDALSVGAGVGTNALGAEWAVHARLRPIWERTPGGAFFQALTLEGSASRARQGAGFSICIDNCDNRDVVPQTVYFGQAEVGWEGMLRGGFTFRVSSGFATALGSLHWECSRYASGCDTPTRQFFVQTFALGWAF